MSESETRSLNQIRRETEQTRAALTTTVEELRGTVGDTAADIKNRLRPEAIKAEVSGYIRSRGEQLFNDMREAARRNPMQAIAVGASVAYPAMRMARAIPLPILMIGAGLFLAGSKTGQDLTQQASDLAADVTEEARRRVDELRGRASELGDQATRAVSGARDRASEALDRAGDVISETTHQASDQVNEFADQTSHIANLSANAAQEKASQVTDAVRDAQARATEAGKEFLDATRERLREAGQNLSETGRNTADTVRDSIQQNPLLVAGVGLLVGGLIASVLPKSETEQSLLGDASDTVKRRARQAAEAGFESAKGAAGEILADAAQQASAEGLTPDGLAHGAQDVSQRVQRVAERAVTTAFDPDQDNEYHQQTESTGGGKQNG
jgi:ElaB/YqjD/DUF883 family membrane-anchored ribosome-binding protein